MAALVKRIRDIGYFAENSAVLTPNGPTGVAAQCREAQSAENYGDCGSPAMPSGIGAEWRPRAPHDLFGGACRRRARYLARSRAGLLHFNLTLPLLDIVPSI